MVEKVMLKYQGRKVKGRKITVSSTFPVSKDQIWNKIQQVETLRYVARPYAMFDPVGEIPTEWKEGDTYVFRTRMHSILPIGKHTIRIVQTNREKGEIVSCEFDKVVRIWEHTIRMKENGAVSVTDYTDIVSIYAGILTPVVAWWSVRFYKHRQRKWKKLLAKSEERI